MILAWTVRYFGENTLKTPKLSHKIEIWAEKLAALVWSSSDFRTKRPQLLTTLSAKWTSRLFENIFVLLAAPRSNSKSVILAGTVCKNSDALICHGGFWKSSSDQWPAKVSIFDGRVVKNRGSRNSSAMPGLPA